MGDVTRTTTTKGTVVFLTYRCVRCGRYLGEGLLYGESFFQMKCPDRHCRAVNQMTPDGIVVLNS